MDHFGYYGVDTVQYGKLSKKVKGHTNIAYTGASGAGFSDATPEARATYLRGMCNRLTKNGLHLVHDLELSGGRLPWGQALKCAKKVWDKVDYIILDDEVNPASWTAPDLDIEMVRKKIEKLRLSPKPIGATFTTEQVLNTPASWFDPFDFVNIEAYSPLPVDPSPSASFIANSIHRQIDHLGGKPVTVVMQAYDRNGAIKSVEKMVDIQWATFRNCQSRPEVEAIFMFAYGRKGGSMDYPQLVEAHKEMWRELMV